MLPVAAAACGGEASKQPAPGEEADALPPSSMEIACGYRHACVLRTDGSVRCWGKFVGDVTPADNPGPFTQISAGYYVCGLRPDGSLACWGKEGDVATPDGTFVAIRQTTLRSCALRADSSAICFDIDRPEVAPEAAPVALRAVSVGNNGPCGLRASDGHPICWKSNSPAPAPEEELTALAVGGSYACGLRPNGTIACWGKGLNGELDAPSGSFVEIGANIMSACARREDGTLACWGVFGDRRTPFSPDGKFVAHCVGDTFGCGIRVDGHVQCWGLDAFGQASPPGDL